MARYCEYCGRRIDDGECDCPEAVAARENEALAQTASGAADSITSAQAGTDDKTADKKGTKSKVEEVLGTTGAEVALDLKELFTGMFTSPVETLKKDAERQEHTSSYIIAAILSVLTFLVIAILGDNTLVNATIGRGTLVIFSLAAAIAIFVFKVVYAACITIWGKKYNPDLTYSSALGTFCLIGIYDVVILLAFALVTVLSIYELSLAILFFWLIMTAVSGMVASWVLTKGQADSVIRINLVLMFVFILFIILTLRGLIIDMCVGAVMAFVNSFGGF